VSNIMTASILIPGSSHSIAPSLCWILGSGGLFVSTLTGLKMSFDSIKVKKCKV